LEEELVKWISTHRHTQQAIYFLSQHTDQFANQVLGIADMLLEIVNVKSLFLPFPISIPMSDIDELKRSFGIKTQYYQANVGNFRGKAIRWSGGAQRNLMSADIFRVYQSHASGMESSDRPSLRMNGIEGLIWFFRRHAWHLIPKLVGILSLPFILSGAVMYGPKLLASSVSSQFGVDQQSVQMEESKQNESGKTSVVSKQGAFGESKSVVGESLVGVSGVSSSSGNRALQPVGGVSEPTKGIPTGFGGSTGGEGGKVVMLYERGVILDDGRKVEVGETFTFGGRSETLSVACPACGVIVFLSGKRMKL
jgi:hypothetical protein